MWISNRARAQVCLTYTIKVTWQDFPNTIDMYKNNLSQSALMTYWKYLSTETLPSACNFLFSYYFVFGTFLGINFRAVGAYSPANNNLFV